MIDTKVSQTFLLNKYVYSGVKCCQLSAGCFFENSRGFYDSFVNSIVFLYTIISHSENTLEQNPLNYSLCDHLTDAGVFSLSWVLVLLLPNLVSGSRLTLMFIPIPHYEYHVKFSLSSWFSAACDAAITNRNHFFHLY